MSKKLFLVRHAQAVNTDLGMKDFDRSLTAEGYRDATHIGLHLHKEGIILQAFYSSTSLRTRETSESIANQIKFENHLIKFEEDLYEPSVRVLLELINKIEPKVNIALIVSHNPAISYLGEYLTGEEIGSLYPAAMLEVDFEVKGWDKVSQNSGTLKSHFQPEQT